MSQQPAAKAHDEFRNYAASERACVNDLYRENHTRQTLAFVRQKHAEYLPLRHCQMSVWEAIEALDAIVDDSDPDIGLSQLHHALQTAESLRAAGEPRWMILTGLIHDLGKVLCTFGEPQWAVVGDTFPVGCAFDQRIVYPDLFAGNPDIADPTLRMRDGIYREGCGLDAVLMSWGHDEYLYHVTKDYLALPAQYVIRYHSFYAWHREGAYDWLCDEQDRAMLSWVRRFNSHDLYSKSSTPPDRAALRPFYEELLAEYLPPILQW